MRTSIYHRVGLGAVAIAIAAVAAAGCGGGTSTPLSRQEFVSRADAICKEEGKKKQSLPTPSDMPTLALVTSQQISIANETYGRLVALTPPSDVQDKYSKWLNDSRAQIAVAGQLEAAAKAGNSSKAKALSKKLQVASTENDAEARALGLKGCAAKPQ